MQEEEAKEEEVEAEVAEEAEVEAASGATHATEAIVRLQLSVLFARPFKAPYRLILVYRFLVESGGANGCFGRAPP
jgi:hypothetical protein